MNYSSINSLLLDVLDTVRCCSNIHEGEGNFENNLRCLRVKRCTRKKFYRKRDNGCVTLVFTLRLITLRVLRYEMFESDSTHASSFDIQRQPFALNADIVQRIPFIYSLRSPTRFHDLPSNVTPSIKTNLLDIFRQPFTLSLSRGSHARSIRPSIPDSLHAKNFLSLSNIDFLLKAITRSP